MDEIAEGAVLGFATVDFLIEHQCHILITSVYTSLFETSHKVPLNQGLSTWLTRFHQLKVDMTLAVKCSAIQVTLIKTETLHLDAGR